MSLIGPESSAKLTNPVLSSRSHPKSRRAFLIYLAVAMVGVVAMALTVHQLGWYRQDWLILWSLKTGLGSKLNLLLETENSLVAVIYTLLYRYFGSSKLAWQVWIILLRLLTSLGFLRILRLLWPKNPVVTFVIALMFVVYPGFTQLSSALTYSTYYLAFGIALLSIWLSLIAIDTRSTSRIALIIASILLSLLYMRIYPYMIGFEGVRFILIAYRYYQRKKAYLGAWMRVALPAWLPYILPLLVMAYWRFLAFPGSQTKTALGLLRDMLVGDFSGSIGLLFYRGITDFVKAVLGAWVLPLINGLRQSSWGEMIFAAALGLLALSIAWIALSMLDSYSESKTSVAKSPTRLREVIIVGVLWTFFTILPVTLSTQFITFNTPQDRFALHTAGGAVILLVALLMLAVRWRKLQQVLTAGLVFIGVVSLVLSSFHYLHFWNIQRSAWWQFYWRSPDLREDTALVMQLPPNYALAEGYEVWVPANLIYQKNADDLYIQGEIVNPENVNAIAGGELLVKGLPSFTVASNFQNGLITSNSSGGCLHVYDSNWFIPYINENPLISQAAVSSTVSQIKSGMPVRPPAAPAFGSEPTHDWCYYYQKASFSVQHNDRIVIRGIWNQIQSKKLQPAPGNELEWLPVFEGLYTLNFHIDSAEVESKIRANPQALQNFCSYYPADSPVFAQLTPERAAIVRQLCSE